MMFDLPDFDHEDVFCFDIAWNCDDDPIVFMLPPYLGIFRVDDLYLSMTPIAETSSALSVLAMSATLDDSSGSILFRASWERCWTENLHISL